MLSNIDLKNLPVYTKSGVLLGRITRFYFSEHDQRVVSYDVCGHFFKFKHTPEYHIGAAQVLEITTNRMLVEDAVLKEKSSIKKTVPLVTPVIGETTANTARVTLE